MKTVRLLFASIRGHVRIWVIGLVLMVGALASFAATPAWWATRGVTNTNPADDFAPLNQGQLKKLVKAATQELDANLPGGAGNALHLLIVGWATPAAQRDDFAAVNLGQLKAVAKPVYDRFKAVGFANNYPWENSPQPPDDFAMANIGQAKNLFNFNLTFSTVGDGIPDWWRLLHFGSLDMPGSGATDSWNHDGVSNLTKYHSGADPTAHNPLAGEPVMEPPAGAVVALEVFTRLE